MSIGGWEKKKGNKRSEKDHETCHIQFHPHQTKIIHPPCVVDPDCQIPSVLPQYGKRSIEIPPKSLMTPL